MLTRQPEPDLMDDPAQVRLLHHLDDPAVLWETVRQTAKPGAPILVMDLLRPDSFVDAGLLGFRVESVSDRHLLVWGRA